MVISFNSNSVVFLTFSPLILFFFFKNYQQVVKMSLVVSKKIFNICDLLHYHTGSNVSFYVTWNQIIHNYLCKYFFFFLIIQDGYLINLIIDYVDVVDEFLLLIVSNFNLFRIKFFKKI